MNYIKLEQRMFWTGLAYLLGSLLIDLSVPIYIGMMIDQLNKVQNGDVTAAEMFVPFTILVLLLIGVSILCDINIPIDWCYLCWIKICIIQYAIGQCVGKNQS